MNVNNLNKKGENIPVMIFANKTKEGQTYYQATISKKNEDNSWSNAYMFARFNKGITIEDKTKILIKNAILDFSKKDKTTTFFLRIFDFDIVKDAEHKQEMPY